MFKFFSSKFFGLFALAAAAAICTPQAVMAQGAQLCSLGNAVMNGTYVASGTGTVMGVGPITAIALVVYNGDGTAVSLSGTTTVNGTASSTGATQGSYTVNPDCTGTKVFGTGASAVHYNFVVSPDGSTITWIVTDNGVTMTGTGVRVKP